MNTENFKEEYKTAKTWGDCEELLEKLDEDQLQEFIDIHEKVAEYTGLDVRQEFYLSHAKIIITNIG